MWAVTNCLLCQLLFRGQDQRISGVFSRIGSVWSGIAYLISMILSGIEHLDLVLFLSHIQYSHQRISGACWGQTLIAGRWNKEEMHWSLVGNALLHFISSAHICLLDESVATCLAQTPKHQQKDAPQHIQPQF